MEKDWCSFGHRFATRCGYGHNLKSRTSPIFPQFLDATYQLLRQFPTSFEFSENLLLLLVHAFCSRRVKYDDNGLLSKPSHYFRALVKSHARSRGGQTGLLARERPKTIENDKRNTYNRSVPKSVVVL